MSTSPVTLRLFSTPHRAWFLVGLLLLLLSSLYWALQLLLPGILPQTVLPPGWVHAWLMLYGFLPILMFGFLMTTFPAWMGQSALTRLDYLGPLAAMTAGWLATAIGLLCSKFLAMAGSCLFVGGWAWALWGLTSSMIGADQPVIHARVTVVGLVLGLAGASLAVPLIATNDWRFFYAGTRIAVWGFLLPVLIAVCHRMIPFFTHCIDPDKPLYRPHLTLWLQLLGCLLHLGLELRHLYQWLFLIDLPLLALALLHLIKWWPRGRQNNALLLTLHVGHAWLVLALALYCVQSIVLWQTGAFVLGRAPVHALGMGFAGSMVVAMVTRVSQGHSGRALKMPPVAQFAFVGIQLACVLRIINEFGRYTLNQVVVLIWLACLLPWIMHYGLIYLRPRADGKAG